MRGANLILIDLAQQLGYGRLIHEGISQLTRMRGDIVEPFTPPPAWSLMIQGALQIAIDQAAVISDRVARARVEAAKLPFCLFVLHRLAVSWNVNLKTHQLIRIFRRWIRDTSGSLSTSSSNPAFRPASSKLRIHRSPNARAVQIEG
jgi:hypothetical protein